VSTNPDVDDVGFDARATAAGLRQLFSEGLRVSPGLADATFREVRVGLRPVSDDDLLILGPLTDAPNVHGRRATAPTACCSVRSAGD